MMSSAYNIDYLDHARQTLAVAVDYAVNYRGKNIDTFFYNFIGKGIAFKFENGNPSVTVGISGVDLYKMVEQEDRRNLPAYESFDRSPEYWLGWALAYFQCIENRTFQEILFAIQPSEMLSWYPTMHEADITYFESELCKKMEQKKAPLKYIREQIGISQNQLSMLSGVPASTIRSYEQRTKDIRKAQYNVLNALSRVLQCQIEDITGDTSFVKLSSDFFVSPTDSFGTELFVEVQRMQENRNVFVGNNVMGQARKNSYLYEYISQFPFQKLKKIEEKVKIQIGVFFDHWTMFWNNKIQSVIKDPAERQKLVDTTRIHAMEVIKENEMKKDSNTMISNPMSIDYNKNCILDAKKLIEQVTYITEIIDKSLTNHPKVKKY